MLVCLKREGFLVVNDGYGEGGRGLATKEKKYQCKRQPMKAFHDCNYTLTNLMHYPHIWLNVNPLILFNIHLNWDEGVRDDVLATLREL